MKKAKQSCCDAEFSHVHCQTCNKPSPDSWECITCFYKRVET